MTRHLSRLTFIVLSGLLLRGETVSPLHPRIFVRNDAAPLGKGLRVSELRARLKDPHLRRWRHPLSDTARSGVMERAARYLETGDPADLAAARDFLLKNTFSYEKHDVWGFLAGAEMAAAFDWIYDGLIAAERLAAMANIVATAESSRRFLEHGEPDINHNYTYMALNTVAVAGLTLRGEPEPYGAKARECLALARRFIEGPGMALDTWRARQGAWSEGSHYAFHETLRNLVLMLAAYRTASDADYFARVEKDRRNFLAEAGRFLIYSTRPDFTFERTGDGTPSRILANGTIPSTLEALAWGLGDRKDAARLRSFAGELITAYGDRAVSVHSEWAMRFFHEPSAPRAPSFHTLPLGARMGAGTTDHIVLRSGWSQDSTMVTILAGDHFTDHQHFDKGHFLIYRRGGLAIDGGAYDELYKPGGHWNEYASRTLAHNCLLVYDPGQAFLKGFTNDGGQRVIRGKQHHADWPSYVAHRDAEGLNTADVEAFAPGENGRYNYVRINLRNAYGEKVTSYTREFVYLPGVEALVVFDRVAAARPEFAKRWLLHLEDRPEVDGHTPAPGLTRFPGARLTTVRRDGEYNLGGRTVRYDGVLFVQTLLPAEREVTVIGGPGYEFFNAFLGRNFPVSIPQRAAPPREAGAWRIEVAPAQPAAEHPFLHVLEMAGPAARAPSRAELIGDAGVLIHSSKGAWVVSFASRGEAVRYTVDTDGPADHLVAGLPPGATLAVTVNGRRFSRRANAHGVLVITDRASGRRGVVVEARGPRPR